MLELALPHFNGKIDRHPDHCPVCHTKVVPTPIASTRATLVFQAVLEIAYVCPNSQCREMFIAYFDAPLNKGYRLRDTRPVTPIPPSFSEFIQNTSPSFCGICKEATQAEQLGLSEICGVGYRKALEFLIKDYLIKDRPNDAEAIKSTPLGACIENYVRDGNVKQVAKRAVWLGNDETHYERRWKEKDLNDLKTMINLAVHWMQAEHLTKEALTSMAQPGP